MNDTVKIKVSSTLNISFNHVIDTDVERDEWNDMSDAEQVEVVTDTIFNKAIDWNVVDDDD